MGQVPHEAKNDSVGQRDRGLATTWWQAKECSGGQDEEEGDNVYDWQEFHFIYTIILTLKIWVTM